ncbi:MAG TPA: hypothetical protein VF395_09485, partial [Polyangiaceae bacterium]
MSEDLDDDLLRRPGSAQPSMERAPRVGWARLGGGGVGCRGSLLDQDLRGPISSPLDVHFHP